MDCDSLQNVSDYQSTKLRLKRLSQYLEVVN